MTIVLGWMTVGPSGMSNPNADINCLQPGGHTDAGQRDRAAEASAPTTTASMSTERFT